MTLARSFKVRVNPSWPAFFCDFSRGGSRISCRGGMDPFWGHGPPTRAFFSENVCETKELGPIGGVRQKILYVYPPMACM